MLCVRKKFSVGQKTDGKRENRTKNALGAKIINMSRFYDTKIISPYHENYHNFIN